MANSSKDSPSTYLFPVAVYLGVEWLYQTSELLISQELFLFRKVFFFSKKGKKCQQQ